MNQKKLNLQELKLKKYVYDNINTYETKQMFNYLKSQGKSSVIDNLVQERCLLINFEDKCDLSGIIGYPGLHIDNESNYGTFFNYEGDKVFWFDAWFEYCNYQLDTNNTTCECVLLFYHHEGTLFHYLLIDTGVYKNELEEFNDDTTIKVLEYKEHLLNAPLNSYKVLSQNELNLIIENCKKEIITRNIGNNYTTKFQYKVNENYLHIVKYSDGINITENDLDPCDGNILGENFAYEVISINRRYISYEEIVINLNDINDWYFNHKTVYDWDICDNLQDFKILPNELQIDIIKLKESLFNYNSPHFTYNSYKNIINKLKTFLIN